MGTVLPLLLLLIVIYYMVIDIYSEYNFPVLLYDCVVLVQITCNRLFALSIVCWLSLYLQKTMTTRSF